VTSLRRTTAAVLAAVLVAAGVAGGAAVSGRTTVFRAESGSMAPEISEGDIVVAVRAANAVPARGDVVLFNDPGEWARVAARLTGVDRVAPTFVKRVVGLPGERVSCCDGDGRIMIDGEPLAEPYLLAGTTLASVLAFDVIVPPDAVFVMGDSRSASIDSRDLGPVPLHDVFAVQQWVLRMP